MTDQTTVGWFRTQPPDPPAHTIRRLRLLEVMSTRFDRPLTVVIGGPGHGKTTLMAQAMAENEYDPQGIDLWLCCNTRDRTPEALLAGLAATLGSGSGAADLDDIVDLLVLRSPDSVSLMIDDAHILDGSQSMAVLSDLVERLPRNAHLVIASRTMPAINVRRHQSNGTAAVLSQLDLTFTDHERHQVAGATGRDGTDLPAWPALAMLTAAVGHEAGIEYIWEEVLAHLGTEQRTRLATLTLFDVIDDDLVAAVIGPGHYVVDIVGDLPLVDRIGNEYRIHDLWGDALRDVLGPEARKAANLTAAQHFDKVGKLEASARCFAAAGAADEIVRLARRFITLPITGGLDSSVAEALHGLLPDPERDGPLGQCLAVLPRWDTSDTDRPLLAIDAAARAAGDGQIQSLIGWRLAQRGTELNDLDWMIDSGLEKLAADGWPLAGSAMALARSQAAQNRGDLEAAVAAIADIKASDPATQFAARAARLITLGRPEDVPPTAGDILEQKGLPAVGEQASWLRGDASPAESWPFAAALSAAYSQRAMADVQVPFLAIVSGVAFAAGHFDDARRLADDAVRMAAPTNRRNRLIAAVAHANCLLADEGEATARARLEEIIAEYPLLPWPVWPTIMVLAIIRAIVPGGEALDKVQYGPALSLAVRCGRSAAQIRAGASPTRAADLPWHSEVLMEVHLPPPLRCELALAAAASSPAAAKALNAVPGRDRWLRRLVDHPNRELASLAEERISDQPRRPGYDLLIRTFGGLALERSDALPTEAVAGRGRVTQLLALLVSKRRISRTAVIARLWPNLDSVKASNNLRVSLHKLLDLLQPDRGSEGSFWLSVDGEDLELVAEGVRIDIDEFQQQLQLARKAEAQGVPSAADEYYRAMRNLYRGDFLAGVDDVTIEPERIQLRSLAYAAVCRRSELALARGEPEVAARHAVDAETIDPASERAPRVQILTHLAIGARSAAIETADRLVSRLTADGLEPEADTRLVLDRLRRDNS